MTEDVVNHPKHYTSHPSGVECIQITEHYNFCIGNAIKYLWRAGLKQDAIEDLKKARWYLDREISNREKSAVDPSAPVPSPYTDQGREADCKCGIYHFKGIREGEMPPSIMAPDTGVLHTEVGCQRI